MDEYLDQIFSDLQIDAPNYYGGDFNGWVNDLNEEGQLKLVYEDLKAGNAKSLAGVKDFESFRNKLTGRDNSRLATLSPDYVKKVKDQEQKADKLKKDQNLKAQDYLNKAPGQLTDEEIVKFTPTEYENHLKKHLKPKKVDASGDPYLTHLNSTYNKNLKDKTIPDALKKHAKLIKRMEDRQGKFLNNTQLDAIKNYKHDIADPNNVRETYAFLNSLGAGMDPNLPNELARDAIQYSYGTISSLGFTAGTWDRENETYHEYLSRSGQLQAEENRRQREDAQSFYQQEMFAAINEFLETDKGIGIYNSYLGFKSETITNNIYENKSTEVKSSNPKLTEKEVNVKTNLDITDNLLNNASTLTNNFMGNFFDLYTAQGVVDKWQFKNTVTELKEINKERKTAVEKRALEIYQRKDWVHTSEGYRAAYFEALKDIPLTDKQKEVSAQHKANLNKFMGEGTIPLVGSDGEWILEARNDKDFLDRQREQKQQINELGMISLDGQVNMLMEYETEMLAVIEDILAYGVENVAGDASIAQLIGDSFTILSEGRGSEKTIGGTLTALATGEKNLNTGGFLQPLPSGNAFTDKYNDLLQKYVTMSAAITLNYDPLSTPKSTFGDGEGFFDELAQGFVDMVPETFDVFNVDANERASIFAQEIEAQGYALSESEATRIEAGVGEMIGQSLPALIKMGVEIAATTYLLGGAGSVGAVSRGLGTLTEGGLAYLTGSARLGKAVGTFTNMYVHESIGLLGSNYLGANITHSEGMPVFTFAAGSAIGRMGFARLGAVMGPGFDTWWNTLSRSKTYGGGVARRLNMLEASIPTRGTRVVGKRFGEAAVGTAAIKVGETTSGLYDVATGEVTFDEFWHHTTDVKSFISLFGGLVTMGMMGKPNAKEMYRAVKGDIWQMQGGKRFSDWNMMAESLGLPSIKKISKTGKKGDVGEGVTSWSEADIIAAKQKKLKEIRDSEMSAEDKIQAEALLDRTAKALGLKGELDLIYVQEGLYDSFFSSKDNMRNQFDRSIDRIKQGKFSEVDVDALANYSHNYSPEYVSLKIQEATGMEKIDADVMVQVMNASAKATTDRGFGMNSPYRAKYLETAEVDQQITRKRKAVKENKNISDGARDVELAKLDQLAEQNKVRQDDLAAKQTEWNKKQAEIEKKRVGEESVIEVGEGQTVDDVIKELNPEMKVDETKQLDFGAQTVDRRRTINGVKNPNYGKSRIIVDPQLTDRVFTGSMEKLYSEGNRGARGTIIHEGIHKVTEKYTNVNYLAKKLREQNTNLTKQQSLNLAKLKKDNFVKDFIKVLKQTGEYDAVLSRVKDNIDYEADKLTNEWFSVYGEMVNRGELPQTAKTRKLLNRFGKNVSEFLNTSNPKLKAEFESGNDVREFIRAFADGKGMEANEVYKKAVKEYEELVKDYDLGQPLRNSVQRDAKDVMAKEYNRITRLESMLKQGMPKEEAIKRAQEIWDKRGADEFISEIYTDGILDRLIMSYIPTIKPPGWLREQVYDPMTSEMVDKGDLEFKQSVYTELISHIRNFKVGKQTTSLEQGLFAWVNSQLLNKVGEVYKKGQMGTKEQYDMTFDQARESGREEGALDADFEEKEIAKDRSPEKIISDLNIDSRTKRILDKDMTDIDFSKVSDVEVKGGKNQKIAPFIRDYKKQAGDKLGKTIYEDVLLKGKNVEYLNENFKSIVENVDIGYLSKNFPFLIEKRVGGVYTKNWKGKKVDKFTLKESGMTSQPEYVRLDPEFNTELNKQQFVDALTKFPDSKNIARDRAAKNKALAYQMGADIAIAEFRKQTNEAVDAQLKVTKATEDIAKVRRDVQRYRELKAEHPEWTSQRLSRETNGITESNYFDRIEALRETIVNEKIRIDDQPLFKAYKDSRAEIKESELPKNVSTVIENSLFRRNTVKNLNTEQVAELFSKSQEMKDWFIKNNTSTEVKITSVPWKKIVDEIFVDYSKEYKDGLVKDLIRGQKIYDRIESNRAKNNNKRARELSERFESILETGVESAGISKLYERLLLPEGISNKEIFLDKDIRAEATQSTLRYTTERIKTGGIDAATSMWSMKGQYTGGSGELARLEKDAARYKNADIASVPLYFEKVWKPAMEANGYTVEYTSGNPRVFKNGKPVEVNYPANLKKGGAELKKIMQPDFVNKKNQLKLNDPKFKAEIERQNKEADLANTELQAQMLDKAQGFHLGTEAPTSIYLWAKNLQSDMGGVLRGAARITEIYQPLKGETYITGKDINSKTLRYEHNPPADVMVDRLGEIYFDSKNVEIKDVFDKKGDKIGERVELTKEAQAKLDKIMSEYTVKIIPESMDKVLQEAGLESMTPGEKDRYYNWRTKGDPRMRPLIDVDPKSSNYGKVRGEEFTKAESRFEEVMKLDQDVLVESGVYNRNSVKNKSIEDVIESTDKLDKTLDNARKIDPKVKKIRVFDFDDTVARTKSKVFAEKGGERKTLTAEEFAKQGEKLQAEGWKMDFSDFNKVVKGKKGPLFDLMKKMKDAAGERDMFILTARSQESAPAIKEFLDAMGIKIPLENITGLGNSTGEAKAEWILDKTSEGYNDFYFADDAIQNVKAVKDILSQVDVKSQVQQARINRNSVKLDETFNKIIEGKTGIEFYKEFSQAKGRVRGAKKGKIRLTLPSAQDFAGLMDYTLGKGKVGEAQREFYNETLYKPYSRAQRALSTDRVTLMGDFKTLKKSLDVPKDLRRITDGGFTKEQAVRVYLWNKTGKKIPGISSVDAKDLINLIESDGKLKAFADSLIGLTKGDGYSSPKESWLAGTITTDLIDLLQTTKRSKYLEEWQANVDVLFSNKNLNKLEAGFGKKYRESLENSLARMKAGKNRIEGGNSVSDKVLDYLNGAQGTIMFLNMRSATLQTISSANYLNYEFNNPLRAGQAFANQPQYWKDFMKLINSDYLKDRRNGLKLNITESEIADAAATGTNKAKAAIAYILEKGYTPTKFADSFAIASGGATWYRNKIRSLKKKGISEAEAEKIAYDEWIEISEKSQQSSDPSKISGQQSSDMGRIFLQFVNTPMQYNRLMIADGKDLVNGRGNPMQKISRIIYYGAMQNLWFNFMQGGMFALGFGDFGDSEIEDKTLNMVNSMSDGLLRGTGLPGMTVSVIKNVVIDIMKESGKKRPDYEDSLDELLNFSPAIKSKFNRLKSAAYEVGSKQKQQEIIDKGFSLDNPAFKAFCHVVSAVTNAPLDRAMIKNENLKNAFADDTETWMRIANFAGWPEWQLTPKKERDAKYAAEKKAFKDKQKAAKQMNSVNVVEEKESPADSTTTANVDRYYKMSKQEQVDKLDSLGFTKKQIRTQFNTEQKRVDKLLRLIESDSIPSRLMKTEAIPINKRTPIQVKLYKMTKANQVKMLKDLGISDSDIENLTYEADRVKEIERLQKNKKKSKKGYKNYLQQKQL